MIKWRPKNKKPKPWSSPSKTDKSRRSSSWPNFFVFFFFSGPPSGPDFGSVPFWLVTISDISNFSFISVTELSQLVSLFVNFSHQEYNIWNITTFLFYYFFLIFCSLKVLFLWGTTKKNGWKRVRMREKVINRADQDHPSRISQWDSGKGQLWQSDQRVEHILPHNIEGHHHFLTHQTWINLEDLSSPWRNDSKVNFGQPVPVCNIFIRHRTFLFSL